MLTIIELMHIPKNCQEEKLGFNGGEKKKKCLTFQITLCSAKYCHSMYHATGKNKVKFQPQNHSNLVKNAVSEFSRHFRRLWDWH